MQQFQALRGLQFRHPAEAGTCGQDGKAVGSGEENVLKLRAGLEEVEDVLRGSDAKQHVHVGKAEICVQKADPLSCRRKLAGQIDCDIGLAHTTLAGCDCEDSGCCCHALYSSRNLSVAGQEGYCMDRAKQLNYL